MGENDCDGGKENGFVTQFSRRKQVNFTVCEVSTNYLDI